jgi:nucleoside-diphosphate-sugar epimerase
MTDAAAMAGLVKGQDYVFSLAGLSGAGASNAAPLEHMRVNCGGQLTVLEACRAADSDVRVFFPSSQLVYGPADGEPVKETHATEPISIYGIHKLAVEKYFHLYHDLYGLSTSVLRIPNPYGPGHKVGLTYGIVNFFITELLAGKTIKVFGDGSQIRDYIYISDLVDAILMTAAADGSAGRVFNTGGPEPARFGDMAKMVFDLVGSGNLEYAPWPPDADKTEVGDIFLDKTEIETVIGWRPKTALTDGLKRTVEFYRSFLGRASA